MKGQLVVAKITINDVEYDSEKLSEDTINQFNSIRITDTKIQQLQAELGIAQTARNAYAQALQAALNNEEFDDDSVSLLEEDENLKFD
jgi:hypothetical protein